tara:strand:+ start:639 stop:1127 length:489 start_codon:yes stop_codon:yes gene_type:complete
VINSRHRRFYSGRSDKKSIPKLQIKSGMVVEFNYRDENENPSRPLVLVMDTNEFATDDKKSFSGLNLNYLPHTEIEKLFERIFTKVGWELDKETKFPKLNLYEEENIGVRPIVIFKPFIKTKLLNRFDCWRTFKYKKVKTAKQIKYQFKSKSLSKIYENLKK